MTLQLFTETYRENPRIGSNVDADGIALQNNVARPFIRSQDVISQAVSGTGGTFSAPPNIDALFLLNALTDIATGVTTDQYSMLDNEIKGTEKVWIVSSEGFAQFQIYNKNINKDFFNQPIFDEKGYGKIYKIQGYMIVVLHPEFLPKGTYDASGAAGTRNTDNITFPIPSSLGGSINRGLVANSAGTYDAANHTTTAGLHQSLFTSVKGLMLYKPDQYNIDFFDFREKDYSHEKVLYGRTSLRGIRGYDSVVFRYWFTDAIGQDLQVIS